MREIIVDLIEVGIGPSRRMHPTMFCIYLLVIHSLYSLRGREPLVVLLAMLNIAITLNKVVVQHVGS